MICNLALAVALSALGIGVTNAQAADPRVADLVQTGKLRVGLFSSQFTKDPVTGELKGVRIEFARALAARLGVQAVLLEHRAPPDVVACLKAGACDVVFLPFDERAANVGDFSPPIIQSEYTMLVPAGSAISSDRRRGQARHSHRRGAHPRLDHDVDPRRQARRDHPRGRRARHI